MYDILLKFIIYHLIIRLIISNELVQFFQKDRRINNTPKRNTKFLQPRTSQIAIKFCPNCYGSVNADGVRRIMRFISSKTTKRAL